MATAATGGERRRDVSLERVFGRTFGTIRANPLGTLGVAFLFTALPLLLFNYLSQGFRSPEAFMRIGVWGIVAGAVAGVALWLALNSLTQGALVRATVAHSQQKEASVAESVVAGLRAFLPLMALTILLLIVEMVGFVLLIVPAIILYCVFAVSAPALVAERIGPIAAMQRSRYLTAGARWKVFAISLIVLVLTWVISATLSAVSFQLAGGMQALAAQTFAGKIPLTYFVIQSIGQTLSACVWSVLASALYVELRDWKDGPQSETLAEVFA